MANLSPSQTTLAWSGATHSPTYYQLIPHHTTSQPIIKYKVGGSLNQVRSNWIELATVVSHGDLHELRSSNTSVHSLSSAYVNGGFQTSLLPASNGNGLAWPLYHPCLSYLLKLLRRKVQKVFMIDFLMGEVSIVVSKSAAAPIERVKLLIQNRDEIIKAAMLSELYKGITDCFARTIKNEDVFSL
uniref:ADP/ATP translocase n=1 Tax=Vitis vinifera TaxID=29760 RepID=F6I1T3_VITVI